MTQHLVFLLLGLANGAVYAAMALALVVTYRSSGVVNFATGTMALFSAYTYAFLRRGELLVLIPGLPKTVRLADSMGFWPAAATAVALSAVLGLVLYLVVFRRLRTAPTVARAVASIGVMVVLTGVMAQRLGLVPITVSPILPTSVWTIGSMRVSSDRVWFALVIVAVSGAISAAFHFTRFGLATRAAAEDEKGAYVSGIVPDRLAAANWMISASVGAVSGILIAPIVPLIPISYTLFIVPALAAALLGRFQLLVPAVIGGLGIGMLQAEVTYLGTQHSWLPASGLPEFVPLALILLVLVVRARPLPSRGALVQRALGRAPRPQRILWASAAGTIACAIALVVLQRSWRAALLTSLVFAVISLSFVVVTGYAGQVSLAQLTLAGVAGFLLGPLTTSWGVPFPVAPLLAAGGAAVVGTIVGLPAVRIRGLPLAVVTLALAVALEAVWFHNTDAVSASGVDISGPRLFGLDLRARIGADYPRLWFCFLVLAVLTAVAVAVARLRISRLGTAMLAVRANERSAAGAGIDVVRVKLVAFAIGAFIAGLGGAMLGYQQSNVTVDSFAVFVGLGLFGTVYLAGITSVSGGVLAGLLCANGLVFTASEEWLHLGGWYSTIMGLGLVFIVIQNPEGIVGPLHLLIERRFGAVRQRRVADAIPVIPEASSCTPRELGPELLSVRGLSVRYGGMVAVDDVSFGVREGSIVGLIGPNGAGKTTLIDAITGFTPSAGSVLLAGESIAAMAPHRRVRSGLARTFQHIELYDDLSVYENVLVGRSGRAGNGNDLDDVVRLLDLEAVADRGAGELSQGRRQLVSVARAMATAPRLLLLDEPAGGLDTTESLWLAERLRRIRDRGVTILLVDHDMHFVLNLCDEIHVLVFGRIIASGPPEAVTADPAVVEAYLGSRRAVEPTARA